MTDTMHTDPSADAPDDEWTRSDRFPRMWNMSAGFMYQQIVRAVEPQRPEYVTIPVRASQRDVRLAVADWNLLWEAAQFRRRHFDEVDLPERMRAVADLGDHNVIFLPRTPSRYYEYAPLYHLLSRATLKRHGLPVLRGGQWPFTMGIGAETRSLPVDFERLLSNAWSGEVWRQLMPGSRMQAFTKDDPVKLLAHNLDFWIPPVTDVICDILQSFPEVDQGVVEQPIRLADGSYLDGAIAGNPRVGSDVWSGEAQAAEVVEQVIDEADANGRLRDLLDAVRSHRVEDDFSDRWSYAREDFERKLHRKRSKTQVRFVEITDTMPVLAPETEIVGQTVLADFIALLDTRERQVVVLLNSGTTNLTEIGKILGYSGHSPISKRLDRIRQKAQRMLDS